MDIRALKPGDDENIFIQLEELFGQMYQYMSDLGLNLPLADNGPRLFVDGIKKTLGRINFAAGAFEGSKLMGFGIASIRIAPPYLGNKLIGTISHIYVAPLQQQQGAGRQLLREMEQWLWQNKVSSVEIEVLCGNTSGIGFWKKNGYKDELIKMRKFSPQPGKNGS